MAAYLGSSPLPDASLGVPAAVLVAAHGRGLSRKDDGRSLHGTTDLYSLAAAMGKMVTTLDLDIESRARADLDFVLENGRLSGWEASMVDVLNAAEKAGKLPEEFEGFEAMGGDVSITASLTDSGSSVSIMAPEPHKVIKLEPAEVDEAEFETAFSACEAR
jgi:hypothetical protein